MNLHYTLFTSNIVKIIVVEMRQVKTICYNIIILKFLEQGKSSQNFVFFYAEVFKANYRYPNILNISVCISIN